jgi:hypothetical protein
MKKRICVEIAMADKLREFLDREKIDIDVVTDQAGDIEVVQCEDRKESNLTVVYSGGWIACGTARGLAKKIEISLSQMGKLLNHLDVKIRNCGLGCFK